MNGDLAVSFTRSLDLFRDQARGEFAMRLVSDVLEPMARELESLSSEIDETAAELTEIESELEGDNL